MTLRYKTSLKNTLFICIGLAALTAQAATKPSRIASFGAGGSNTFSVKSTSWRDPAFGNMGWTHNSDWGSFTASAGQSKTITLTSTVAGFHPGVTVWYRGTDDTAPDNYVVDHFYPQGGNFVEFGAKDETSGIGIGNISMQIVSFGYDQDGHTLKPGLNGLTDRISGKMTLTFKAAKAGNYIFVVGGFNPSANVSKTTKQAVAVNVK
jgi:Copper(I)-binding protein CorA